MTQSQNNGVFLIIVPPFSGYKPSLNIFLPYKEASFNPGLPDHSDLLVIMLPTGLFLQFSNSKIAIYYPISSHSSAQLQPRCGSAWFFLQMQEASFFSGPNPQRSALSGRAETTPL